MVWTNSSQGIDSKPPVPFMTHGVMVPKWVYRNILSELQDRFQVDVVVTGL